LTWSSGDIIWSGDTTTFAGDVAKVLAEFQNIGTDVQRFEAFVNAAGAVC
jgi:hypothetical protein